MALGECRAHFRNAETSVRIAYSDGRLQVLTQVSPATEWSVCVQASVVLPSRGYFGVSAATGGLSGRNLSLKIILFLTNLNFLKKIIMIFLPLLRINYINQDKKKEETKKLEVKLIKK